MRKSSLFITFLKNIYFIIHKIFLEKFYVKRDEIHIFEKPFRQIYLIIKIFMVKKESVYI